MSFRFRARYSLQWRLPILVATLIVSVLAVFLWTTYLQVKGTLLQAGAERATASADQLATMTAGSVRQRLVDQRRTASDPAVTNYLQNPNDQTRQAAEAALQKLAGGGVQVIELWNRTGERLATSASSPAAAAALGSGSAPEGAGLRLNETDRHVVVSNTTEAVVLESAAQESAAPLLGFLTVRRPVNSGSSPDVLNRLVGGGAQIELGGRTGLWTNLKGLVPAPPFDHTPNGTTEYRTDHGEMRLGAWSEITGTPWLVWVDFPRTALLSPARLFVERMSLVSLLFVALAAALSRIVSARITTPLTALTDASEAIAAGDYARRVAADRPDEIGRLGKAFNTMVGRVEEAHGRLEARIQEREHALEALGDSEARHHAIVDVALDSIITTDQHGHVTEFNPAAEMTFGYRKAEVLGRDLADLIIPGTYREAYRQGLARYLSTGHGPATGRLAELTAMRADGSEFPVEVAIQVVQLKGQPMFTAYMRDITARRKAEQTRLHSVELEAENRKVQEASRLKSEFLANMSHELRTPLNAIIGFSSILQEGRIATNDPQYKEFVGHILTGGRHLLQLINDVLDLSKVEAGRLEFWPEPIDLDQVIEEVLAVLKTAAATKQIQLTVSVDSDVRHLVLDPARLKQVLYNYLSNALKFTPVGGLVQVSAVPEGPEMFRLDVTDSGIGIAEGDVPRLFQEFQQLDGGASKQHGGTGLGLALTKRLVESQGGTVGVHSALGVGSVFYAILPKCQEAMAPAMRRLADAVPPADASILVIEDNPTDRERLVDALTQAGYSVEAVQTGAQAVSRCQQRAFDAITLDLLLPDQSGLDVLQQIRETGKKPDAPVVVVTIIADEQVLAGHIVSDMLAKPLDNEALLASLRRVGVEPRCPGRILIVDDDEASARLLAVTLQRLGYTAEVQTDPRVGLTSATASPPSAIVLDLLMPDFDGFQFIDELRSSPINHATPLIVWTVKDLSGAEHRQLSQSAHRVLQKSQSGVDTLLRELHLALNSSNVAV